MAEIIKETVSTQDNNVRNVVITPGQEEATDSQTREYVVYYILGAVGDTTGFSIGSKIDGSQSFEPVCQYHLWDNGSVRASL